MKSNFEHQSIDVIALGAVARKLEASERRRRAADAEHMRLLAEAFDIAAVEAQEHQGYASTGSSSTPHGQQGSSSMPHGQQGSSSMPRRQHSELVYRSIRAEVASTLHLSERMVERQMAVAIELADYYWQTSTELRLGLISLQHATVIVEAGKVIGEGRSSETVSRRGAYETAVLEVALEETPNRLRPIAKRLAALYAEATIDERHEQARSERRVFVTDREDGMSDLTAYLPSVEAHAIYDRLTRMSRALAQAESGADVGRAAGAAVGRAAAAGPEPAAGAAVGRAAAADPEPAAGAADHARRTRDAIRADLFSDLLLCGTPEATENCEPNGRAAIHAHVQVTMTDTALFDRMVGRAAGGQANHGPVSGDKAPELALLGNEAVLGGYGPIDLDSARDLAAQADHWNLVKQDPESGTVISVERYRPSQEMRRLLAARDEHCRFPGCRVPAHRCDLDHTIDAAMGGPTSTKNLAHLCRGHHTLKHHGGWRVKQRNDGELEWSSPTGKVHLDRPPSKVRFKALQTAQEALPLHELVPF